MMVVARVHSTDTSPIRPSPGIGALHSRSVTPDRRDTRTMAQPASSQTSNFFQFTTAVSRCLTRLAKHGPPRTQEYQVPRQKKGGRRTVCGRDHPSRRTRLADSDTSDGSTPCVATQSMLSRDNASAEAGALDHDRNHFGPLPQDWGPWTLASLTTPDSNGRSARLRTALQVRPVLEVRSACSRSSITH